MKRKTKIFILTILILSSFIIFYKYKQNSFLGLTKPQVETESSIIDYAHKNGIKGEILIAKNDSSHTILNNYFSFGNLYVINSKSELIDCNLESLGGRCFQDIQKDICENKIIKKRKFKSVTGEKILDKLFEHSKNISNKQIFDVGKYDYIYIYTWVKYAKASINENSIKFMSCLEKRKEKENFIILSVNTDMIEDNE